MAQVKIYGLRSALAPKKAMLSKAIHDALMTAFELPANKQFHRYILLNEDEFIYSSDRSNQYTIIELSIFAGRSVAAKKQLISLLFAKINAKVGIDNQDIEITIFETPMSNWGIRGVPGDELALSYKVDV